MMVYFTKMVVCLKVILTESVDCERILYHLWYYWNVCCHWAHCLLINTHTHTQKGHIAMWLQFLERHTARMTTSY